MTTCVSNLPRSYPKHIFSSSIHQFYLFFFSFLKGKKERKNKPTPNNLYLHWIMKSNISPHTSLHHNFFFGFCITKLKIPKVLTRNAKKAKKLTRRLNWSVKDDLTHLEPENP